MLAVSGVRQSRCAQGGDPCCREGPDGRHPAEHVGASGRPKQTRQPQPAWGGATCRCSGGAADCGEEGRLLLGAQSQWVPLGGVRVSVARPGWTRGHLGPSGHSGPHPGLHSTDLTVADVPQRGRSSPTPGLHSPLVRPAASTLDAQAPLRLSPGSA